METKTLGRYIVADPAICHGEPTFRGTRILVADVLEQVASGMAWDAILEEWPRCVGTRCKLPKGKWLTWHLSRGRMLRSEARLWVKYTPVLCGNT